MDFLKELNKYKEDIIKHTMELVKIPSELVENEVYEGKTYRFGYQNKKALDYYLNLAESLGFKTKNIEDICGHVEYGPENENNEIFACLCHLDVVPAIGDWKNPPYEPWIEDGKIFGRGTQDDKGPAVVSLYALKVLKDLGFKPNRRIRLLVGTDEESGSRGLHRYLQVEENPSLGISPDAEFPLIYGEKGITSFDIECENTTGIIAQGGVRYNVVAPWVKFSGKDFDDFLNLPRSKKEGNEYILEGKSAHAMEPNNGINAIKEFMVYLNKKIDNKFVKFINENLLDTRLNQMGLNITSPDMGDLTMNMGVLEMNDKCKLGINMRYPNNMDFETFKNKFESIAKEYGLDVKVLGNVKPHYIDPQSEYIQTLYNSYKKYTNDNSPLKTIGGGTYARDIKNGVAFGVSFPDDEEVAHEVNEYISIEKLIKAGVIIADAIYNVNK